MVGQCVHHDSEGENVPSHHKHQAEQQPRPKDLTSDPAKEYLAPIRNAMNMWIPLLELPHYVAGVNGEDSNADDQYHAPWSIHS
ncbi:hypothetical protein V6Z92_003289 [Aspergillus fumigatus]